MTYIPFNETQWLLVEFKYRDCNPGDTRKRLPVREVASWFSEWVCRECLWSHPAGNVANWSRWPQRKRTHRCGPVSGMIGYAQLVTRLTLANEVIFIIPEYCTYYTRVAFGMLRCQGATLAGKCGHPDKLCPVNRQYHNKDKVIIAWLNCVISSPNHS